MERSAPAMNLTRLALGLATLVVAISAGAMAGDAQREATSITCTNVASGTSWQVKIDFDRGTADANPARISDAQISWHDAMDGGNYTLDRKSGDLTVVVASSTGGYFLHHRCKL
jgi:hypothetical protein